MPERATSVVVLGIDFGARRIGVATGNTLTGTARPLSTVHHDGTPAEDIDRIIQSWKPGCIVVGLPLAADGAETESSRAARRFAADLQTRHPGLEISFQDERYSSRMADAQFAQARRDGHARRRDARNLDSVAAAIIVESWLAANAPANQAGLGS
ncbi:MAG TPA: Holliday junction resolvase RuvX [Wenzhouxiangellaceae bacterium]|nr:Holliday junction resolvase RuvX [Wenzhouxiangellaceae bacterium]